MRGQERLKGINRWARDKKRWKEMEKMEIMERDGKRLKDKNDCERE